jgi:acetyltransferase-like isoleucine patch superfamily enzyme
VQSLYSYATRAASLRRWAIASVRGVTIAKSTQIGPGTQFRLGFRDGKRGKITVGKYSQFQFSAFLNAYGGSIDIGECVFVGPFVVIYGHAGVEVGDNSLLSMHVSVLSSDHTIPSMRQEIRSAPDILKKTRIGCDVWIGAGSTILGGVSIGDGCVIGAGSVVKRDLPPGAIAMGVPARIISTRAA